MTPNVNKLKKKLSERKKVKLCVFKEIRESVAISLFSFSLNDSHQANGATATLYSNIRNYPFRIQTELLAILAKGFHGFLRTFYVISFLNIIH